MTVLFAFSPYFHAPWWGTQSVQWEIKMKQSFPLKGFKCCQMAHTIRLNFCIENLYSSIWQKISSSKHRKRSLPHPILFPRAACSSQPMGPWHEQKGAIFYSCQGPANKERGTCGSGNDDGLTSGSAKSLRASTFSRTDSSQSASDGVWRKIRVTSPQHSLSFRPGWLRRYGWLKRNNNEISLLLTHLPKVTGAMNKQNIIIILISKVMKL